MPGTSSYLLSEPSVSEQLLFVLLMEAREHHQSLGDRGACGQAGSCHLGTPFFPALPRWEETEQFPASAKLPLPVQELGLSSSQEPETHLRQHLKSIPTPALPPALHCQQWKGHNVKHTLL